MKTLRLTLAYDGTRFAGWQTQRDRRTVQGELEAAAQRVTHSEAKALASGRTDAGVHALGQVVALRVETHLPANVLQRALNAELPEDIVVLASSDAAADFHPIRDALGKRYRYLIHDGPVREVFWRGRGWDYRHGRLDVGAMRRAAGLLIGRHDFAAFQTSGAERATTIRHVRELIVLRHPPTMSSQPIHGQLKPSGAGQGGAGEIGPCATGAWPVPDDWITSPSPGDWITSPSPGDWITSPSPGDWITVEIEADGFLYNMVRAIVGTLVEVGRGAQPADWVAEVLASTDRRRAGPTAPPQGLFLVQVDYPPTG